MLIITFKDVIIIQTVTHFIAAFFNYVLERDCIEDSVFFVVVRGIVVLVLHICGRRRQWHCGGSPGGGCGIGVQKGER